MKSFIIACFLSVAFSFMLSAQQEEDREQYLFPSFENAQVIYKDGRVFNVSVNFNLVSNRFVFVDTHDNNILKEFAEVDKLGIVKVGERNFRINNRGEATEILQVENPRILVEYRGKVKDIGQKAAYGGRSQTSAIESISSFQSGGMHYKLEGDPRYVVSGMEKRYQVDTSKKMKSFANAKQFVKIYSKYKDVLEKYIKEHNVDFDSAEQIVALCNYAHSLSL